MRDLSVPYQTPALWVSALDEHCIRRRHSTNRKAEENAKQGNEQKQAVIEE